MAGRRREMKRSRKGRLPVDMFAEAAPLYFAAPAHLFGEPRTRRPSDSQCLRFEMPNPKPRRMPGTPGRERCP